MRNMLHDLSNFMFINNAWPQCDFYFVPCTPSSMLKGMRKVVWMHMRIHIQHWRGGKRVSLITSILISSYRRQRSILLCFLRCRQDELWWVQQCLQRPKFLESNVDSTLLWHFTHYPALDDLSIAANTCKLCCAPSTLNIFNNCVGVCFWIDAYARRDNM